MLLYNRKFQHFRGSLAVAMKIELLSLQFLIHLCHTYTPQHLAKLRVEDIPICEWWLEGGPTYHIVFDCPKLVYGLACCIRPSLVGFEINQKLFNRIKKFYCKFNMHINYYQKISIIRTNTLNLKIKQNKLINVKSEKNTFFLIKYNLNTNKLNWTEQFHITLCRFFYWWS